MVDTLYAAEYNTSPSLPQSFIEKTESIIKPACAMLEYASIRFTLC